MNTDIAELDTLDDVLLNLTPEEQIDALRELMLDGVEFPTMPD